MPVTGHGIVVGYQVYLQNHNIRNDLIREMSSASGVPTSSRATASRPFEEPFTKNVSSALRRCASE